MGGLTLRWSPALAVSGGSSLPPSHGPETWLLVPASPKRDHCATSKPRGEAVALVHCNSLLRVRVDQAATEGTPLVLTRAHRTHSSGNILRAPPCHRAWLGPEKDPAPQPASGRGEASLPPLPGQCPPWAQMLRSPLSLPKSKWALSVPAPLPIPGRR